MIPKNLEECFDILNKELKPDDLAFIKASDDNATKLHHSLGRYLRNTWGLWGEDSTLKQYFWNLGINHPDDMSSIILHSFHRHLNNKPLDVDAQVKKYQDYWEKIRD